MPPINFDIAVDIFETEEKGYWDDSIRIAEKVIRYNNSSTWLSEVGGKGVFY